MRKTKLFLFILICSAFLSGNIYAQAVGDYGSLSTGNWGTTGANWVVCQTAGQWTDAIAATVVPPSTVNVWIRNGHTITVEASGKVCNNITIETGALLKGADLLPTSSLRYLRIYGSTMTVNGQFGNSAIDNLGIQPYGGAAQVLTITGTSPIINICRIQPQTAGQSIIFDINAQINYAGSAGAGSTGLYANNLDYNVTINTGKTITMANSSYIAVHGSSGQTAGTSNMTINVNGTLTASGSNSIINLNTAVGKTVTLNVGSTGTINSYGLIRAFYTNAGTVNINIADGGTINSYSTGALHLSKASISLNGTISTENSNTDSLGTATISTTGKFKSGRNKFPVGNITLNSGSTVEYFGSTAYTIPLIPTSYQNLTINNPAGLSLGVSTSAAGSIVLSSGKLTLGDFNLTAGNVTGANTSNYIVAEGAGALTQTVPASTEVLFPVGSASAYTPVKVNPATASDFAVRMTTSPGAAPGNTLFNPDTWEISPTTASSTVLTLTASSVASTKTNVIYHWNGSTYDAISATLTGNDYSATVTDFSPFTTGGSTVATADEMNNIKNVYFDGKTIHNPNNVNLRVYDVTGKKIDESTFDINLSGKVKGIYIIKGENSVIKVRL